MKYKVGDIVEIIEILDCWALYPQRYKIYKKPCKITELVGCDSYIVDVGVGKLHLTEYRFKPYVEVGKQLEFNFMQ